MIYGINQIPRTPSQSKSCSSDLRLIRLQPHPDSSSPISVPMQSHSPTHHTSSIVHLRSSRSINPLHPFPCLLQPRRSPCSLFSVTPHPLEPLQRGTDMARQVIIPVANMLLHVRCRVRRKVWRARGIMDGQADALEVLLIC